MTTTRQAIYNICYYNPLYFVRSGCIELPIVNGPLWLAGRNGNYWTGTASSKIWNDNGFGAFYLEYYDEIVNPGRGPYNRWFGFPLRGLANPCRQRRGKAR